MSGHQENSPAISAVLLCRNERNHIAECVESLLAQQVPDGGFELLVIDGMSDDGTRDVLKIIALNARCIRLLDNEQRVTPCGMNMGIRCARGKWVAVLGSHNRYAPDYLQRCYEVANKTGADNVGGSMYCEGIEKVQEAIAAAHHSPFSCGGAPWHDPNFEGRVDTVFGGFYKREVFEWIGYFDESLVRNQDDEFNLRLSKAGGLVWHSPKIRSWYRPRASLPALFNQYVQYGYWKVRVIQKHKLPASWRHLVPAVFLLALLSSFLLSAFSFVLIALRSQVSSRNPEVLHFSFQLSAFSFLLILSAYLLAVVAASFVTAAKSQWKLLPILPLVFPCYHFGYGYGFLRGIWDFVIRRKRGHKSFETLTR